MMHLFFAAALAAVVVFAAWRIGALTGSGASAAWLVGTVVLGLGGWLWAGALLTFFGTSSALSRWRRHQKKTLGYEKTGARDGGQVWANGGVATLCALWHAWHPSTAASFVCFLAALAAANADTWATEIGSASKSGKARMITTGKRVTAGTSGAVSLAGTLAALGGATLVAAFGLTLDARFFGLVTLAGFSGALIDSLLGATMQAQWRDPKNPFRLSEKPQIGQTPARGWPGVSNDVVNFFLHAQRGFDRGNFDDLKREKILKNFTGQIRQTSKCVIQCLVKLFPALRAEINAVPHVFGAYPENFIVAVGAQQPNRRFCALEVIKETPTPGPRRYVSAEQIEDVVRQLKDVVSVRVMLDSLGRIDELHALASARRAPKQLVRDIESALMAHLGVEVDHKRVSIAQAQGRAIGGGAGRPRLQFVDVALTVSGARAEASVHLKRDDVVQAGYAVGHASSLSQLRLIASATLRAVENSQDREATMVVEDIQTQIPVAGRTAVLVLVSAIVSAKPEELMTGSALVRQDVWKAVVNATLDAVNRRVSLSAFEEN